jgi:hypothetical protein
MKQNLLKVLVFLRIVDDHDSMLSITNLAMFIVLYKLFMTQTTSINDLGTLLVALSGYNLKKFMNADVLVKSLQNNKIVQKAEELVSSNQ